MRNQRDEIFRAIPRNYQQSATVSPLGNPLINVSIDKKSCQRATVFITQVWLVQYVVVTEKEVDIQMPYGGGVKTETQRSAVRRSNMTTRAQNSRCEKSGSLVVDAENYASGLIFAGADAPESSPAKPAERGAKMEIEVVERIENCGVANPMSDVLTKLKMELML